MRKRKFYERHGKAPDGSGRQAIIKHILVPKEVKEEIDLYKLAYSVCLSHEKKAVPVTYELILRRWMDNLGRIDPDVQQLVQQIRAEGVEQAKARLFPVDPTKGKVWNMKYFYERNGDELKAEPDEKYVFFAVIDGEFVGYEKMLADGWMLMNDAGIEIDEIEIAQKIAMKILLHRDRS